MNHPIKKLYDYIIFLSLLVLLCSCGSSGQSTGGGGSEGSVVFSIQFPKSGETAQAFAAAVNISCAELGISEITAQVFDSNNAAVTPEYSWSCLAGQGTMDNIRPGTNLSLVIGIKDSSGNVTFTGTRTHISVFSGRTTDLGIIDVIRPSELNPPIANNDITSVKKFDKVVGNVLLNDYSPYETPLKVNTTLVAPASNGEATIDEYGQFTYVNKKECTSDSFTYEITDTYSTLKAHATVTITITESDNYAPVLSNGNVDLTNGTANTTFIYSVEYYDQDGDCPSSATVNIDGSPQIMKLSPESLSSSHGTYTYNTSLPTGDHTYSFSFNDGHAHAVQFPTSGTLSGPSVHPPTWNKMFSDSPDAGAQFAQQTSDGGYIMAGNITSTYNHKAVLLVKTYADGSLEWQKTFGGITTDDAASCVRQTADGGYIIAGYTYASGDTDVLLIKTNASGDDSAGCGWRKTFSYDINAACNDMANSVQLTSDGGYVLTGTVSYSNYSYVLLIKTDSAGDTSTGHGWIRKFEGGTCTYGNSVQQAADGGFIIAGSSAGNVLLIRTNSSGDVSWRKTFASSNNESANSIQLTSDGGFIIAGSSESSIPLAVACVSVSKSILLLKTDANGETTTGGWKRTISGGGNDCAYSILQTGDGGYMVAGSRNGTGGTDAWLVKTDLYGAVVWNHVFGSTGNDQLKSVQQTSDGGYILAGQYTTASGYAAAMLIKTDEDGNAPATPQ